MIVSKVESLAVKCFWQSVISGNGPLEQTVEEGITQTDSTVDEKTISHSFTSAVTAGYGFGSATLSYTVSS